MTTVVEVITRDVVTLTETVVELVEVATAGPQGPTGAIGATGATGPQGPQGTPGSAPQAFTHVQAVPSATWVIAHNLTFRPHVFVEDTIGRDVEGEIEHIDANNLILTFSAAFAGTAYLS